MRGVHAAYYLIHSMGTRGDNFEALDRAAATNFAVAARRAGVGRIIYLGGLGDGSELSAHMASRQEVGDLLRASGIPTIEFRASIVIGSGSASYETVRALVETLPVMITPRWVNTAAQPIAVEDLIDYMLAALDHEGSAVFEIGGRDRVSYAEIIREYARQRGLRRRLVPVPLLSPAASRFFLGLLTPVYGRVAGEMVESLRNETVVKRTDALQTFPFAPRGLSDAIARALTVDFWRVERFDRDRLPRLAAEMKIPGRLWLQFEVGPDRSGGARIRQTVVFTRMLRGIANVVQTAPNREHTRSERHRARRGDSWSRRSTHLVAQCDDLPRRPAPPER
jgi:uncharacterized protein YbjT (DUF2867 family)